MNQLAQPIPIKYPFPTIIFQTEDLINPLIVTVDTRKNFVFLSPLRSQLVLDFNNQNSLSFLNRSWYCSLKDLSSFVKASKGRSAIALWIPVNLASICLFCWNIFSKTSLFHFKTLCWKSIIEFYKFWAPSSQDSVSAFWNVGWESHIVSKWKGFSRIQILLGLKSSKIVQWFECTLGRYLTSASRNKSLQEGLATALSNLSWMKPPVCLRLVQVKRGPKNPRSIK